MNYGGSMTTIWLLRILSKTINTLEWLWNWEVSLRKVHFQFKLTIVLRLLKLAYPKIWGRAKSARRVKSWSNYLKQRNIFNTKQYGSESGLMLRDLYILYISTLLAARLASITPETSNSTSNNMLTTMKGTLVVWFIHW